MNDGGRTEAALLRRVRWQLVAFSGGSTLIVVLLLGAALYATVAQALTRAGTEQLETRAAQLAAFVQAVPPPEVAPLRDGAVELGPASRPGVVFGGEASGTLALVLPAEGAGVEVPVGQEPGLPLGIPDERGAAEARAGRTSLLETESNGAALRVLSKPVETPSGRFVIQVAQDRAPEQQALSLLLRVLGLGALIATLLAAGVGFAYAGRALVPIRDSLRRQREFAAEASHELRTPLAVIKGSLEHLRRHPDRAVGEVGTALADIEAETDQLTQLVDDLLTLARSDSGAEMIERRPTDLAEVVLGAISGLASFASDRGVAVELDPQPAPVLGDPDRLRQLVAILVDNAVRHSLEGGRVEVTVLRDGSTTSLRVEDRGPGIRREHLAHVFDRFWRAPDAPAGGSGLGLAIARWIVDAHGGTISAANRPGGGARFEVALPPLST